MTERMKLTEEDFTEFDLGGETYWKLDCTKEKKQQILEDSEKAEKYNIITSRGILPVTTDWIQEQSSLLLHLEQENKQLLHQVEIDKKTINDVIDQRDNLKQKLSKIEELTKGNYYEDGLDLNNELKAIIKNKK